MKKMIIFLGLCTISQICFNSEKSNHQQPSNTSKSADRQPSTYSREAALMSFYNSEQSLNSPQNSKTPANS